MVHSVAPGLVMMLQMPPMLKGAFYPSTSPASLPRLPSPLGPLARRVTMAPTCTTGTSHPPCPPHPIATIPVAAAAKGAACISPMLEAKLRAQ